MLERELLGWLRMLAAPALEPEAGRLALARFGLPERILDVSWSGLSRVVGPDAASQILSPGPLAEAAIGRALDWLSSAPGAQLVTLADPLYPRLLLDAQRPPLALFVRGDTSLLARRSVCICGGPGGTAAQMQLVASFAENISSAGAAIVTGFETSVELAAAAAVPACIAVFAGAPDLVRPDDRTLALKVAAEGLIASTVMPGTAGKMDREQHAALLAGLSSTVLAIAAPGGSPAISVARMAADLNREVCAVPGDVVTGQHRGCHRLLRTGARLIERPQEVLGGAGGGAHG